MDSIKTKLLSSGCNCTCWTLPCDQSKPPKIKTKTKTKRMLWCEEGDLPNPGATGSGGI